MCACIYMHVRVVGLSWWSEDKWKLLILPSCVSLESVQALSISSKCLYPLRYLIDPVLFLRRGLKSSSGLPRTLCVAGEGFEFLILLTLLPKRLVRLPSKSLDSLSGLGVSGGGVACIKLNPSVS